MGTGLIGFLVIGLVAGWLAGLILRDSGTGILRNLVVGVIGAYLGGYVFGTLAIQVGGLIGQLVMATVGAMVLLFAIGSMRRLTKSPPAPPGASAPFRGGSAC